MNLISVIETCDHAAFNWCMRRRHQHFFTLFSRLISKTADGFLYPLFVPVLLFLELYQLLFAVCLGFAFERILYFSLKNSFKRNRPPEAIPGFNSFIVPSDKFSFPSGHTSAAFLTATFLSFVFPSITIFVYIWALCVGLSRVFLGVHFPTDCVIGAIKGFCVAKLALLAFL